MVREIPPLRVLCLRKVGAHECNAEKTFAPLQATIVNDDDDDVNNHNNKNNNKNNDNDDDDDHPPVTTKRSKGRKSTKSSVKKDNSHNNNKKKTPPQQQSSAWQLLHSFHSRPSVSPSYHEDSTDNPLSLSSSSSSSSLPFSLTDIPMTRMALVGKNASKRMHANDVDINCPFVACRYTPTKDHHPHTNPSSFEQPPPQLQQGQDNHHPHELGGVPPPTITEQSPELVVQYGNCALDCLQSYIDALTEQGRMDDTRLGKHFFQTWRQACLGTSALIEDNHNNDNHTPNEEPEEDRRRSKTPLGRGKKKRKRGRAAAAAATTTPSPSSKSSPPPPPPPQLGSLSLHNCAIADRTMEAMRQARVGPHLAVLDMTGMQNMGDALIGTLLMTCTNLQRLSIKNCRRLSSAFLHKLVQYPCSKTLTSLDVGGCVNMTPDSILEVVEQLPHLVELNAGGLGWTNDQVLQLCQLPHKWTGLGIGFSSAVTSEGLRQALSLVGPSLQRLAIPFCEGAVDNALLGYLGKALPFVAVLDIRGNTNVNTITGWLDGRAAARLSSRNGTTTTATAMEDEDGDGNTHGSSGSDVEDELFVLARYTSIHNNSIEDTKRIHPLYAPRFVCILDGEGSGGGIRR